MDRSGRVKRISSKRMAEYADAYKKHRQHLYAVAAGILKDSNLAEDAVHEAFESVMKLDALPEDPKGAKALLTTVTQRRALNILKNRSHIADDEPDEKQLGYTVSFEGSELAMIISSMPAIYREVILLHYDFGYSAAEISEMLDVSYSTVLKRLERARKILVDEYNGGDHE